jgi:hypothetical protein
MTTAPVRPVSPPGGQLTIRTAPSPRPGMVVGGRPTAQQLTNTACRVVDTHPELTSVKFGPMTFARDERVTRSAGGVARAASRELTAAAGTVEQVRALTAGAISPLMDHDVIPLLRHVDQLGPDLNQLLDSVSQLSHMAGRLPKVFRRRNHPNP